MEIESTASGAKGLVKLTGRMDAQSATAFEEACESWLAQGVSELVVDLSGLRYISSMGLRSFIVIGQRCTEKGGALRLCSLSGLVRQVFEITHIISLFSIYDSVDAALAAA